MNFRQGRLSLAIAIGAIFGALSRFYETELFRAIFGKDFGFYGTFFINVTGCLLMAYILTLTLENIRVISPELRLMTTTGFCGAYTTFSSYALETKNFVDRGDTIMMVLYFVGSAVGGIIAVKIGVFLARLGQSSSSFDPD